MSESFSFVPFRVRIQGDEHVYPGWQPSVRQAKRMVPGSGVMIRQMMGSGMASVTVRLVLDSYADYMALQANLGRTSTLVMRSAFTNARGETIYSDGVKWEHLKNTTLDSLGPPSFEIGGGVEVMATFERAFRPGDGRAE